MESKIELRKFLELGRCQKFVNDFCSEKKVLRKEIVPLANVGASNVVYIVFLEYV